MNRWQIASVQQMRLAGWTRSALTSAVESGDLHRVRRGYYSLPSAPRELVRAVRVGGVATGPTALPFLGVWKAPDPRLHVLVRDNAARLRDPDLRTHRLGDDHDVCVHWQAAGPVRGTLRRFTPLADRLTAVAHSIECYPDEFALATIDSALNRRLLLPDDLATLRSQVPAHRHGLLDLVDGRRQSGGESIAAHRFTRAGYRVESQVRIPGVGLVDTLLERRLVFEIDGRETHDTAAQFEEDRRRDLELSALRYLHLRVTYAQLYHHWALVLRSVERALAS